MNNDVIFEPLQMYENNFKHKVEEEAKKTFEKLLKESKVDRVQNKESVKKYLNFEHQLDLAEDAFRKINNIRTALIVLIVLIFLVPFIVMFLVEEAMWFYISLAICLVAGIGIIIFINTKIRPIIKEREKLKNDVLEKAKKQYQACIDEVRPLCSLFDWNIASQVITRSVPMLQMDPVFDMKKLDLLKNKYGFKEEKDQHTSIQGIQSGSLVGNPFLLVRDLKQTMGMKRYEGTLTITWQERTTDSQGNTRYVTRTQTLVASISKPCPEYATHTYLVYGNEAADKLKFSRTPTYLKLPDEKEVKKYVDRKEDDISRAADKAVKQGKSFTPMSNYKFEALFGGWDRTNEVEYRLLFTPLAQENEINLITKDKYYGDDFSFVKDKCLNYVVSEHMKGLDISEDPKIFYSHDVDEIEKKFNNYINEFFRSFYFALAPILSIPLYQQHKPFEFIYKDHYLQNNPNYELESIANSFSDSYFRPQNSITPLILKAKSMGKYGKTDKVNITAYSFYTVPQVEYVSTFGRDGNFHLVPVYWDEYIPISSETPIGVRNLDTTNVKYNQKAKYVEGLVGNHIFERGLLAFLLNEGYGQDQDKVLDKAFENNNTKEE